MTQSGSIIQEIIADPFAHQQWWSIITASFFVLYYPFGYDGLYALQMYLRF